MPKEEQKDLSREEKIRTKAIEEAVKYHVAIQGNNRIDPEAVRRTAMYFKNFIQSGLT